MTKIFLDYTADALEHQYNAAHWPTFDPSTAERWIDKSTAFHRRINVKADIRYGDTERQSIDFLIPSKTPAPVVAFIHGGYWRGLQLHKQSYSFRMEAVLKAGALVAMIEYDLCPNVSMEALVQFK